MLGLLYIWPRKDKMTHIREGPLIILNLIRLILLLGNHILGRTAMKEKKERLSREKDPRVNRTGLLKHKKSQIFKPSLTKKLKIKLLLRA